MLSVWMVVDSSWVWPLWLAEKRLA